jgi:Na+/phosphate symporter
MLNKKNLDQIGDVIENKLEEQLKVMFDNKLKPIKKSLRYLTKTVKIIARNYDDGDVALAKRVTKIEKHLSLPENN